MQRFIDELALFELKYFTCGGTLLQVLLVILRRHAVPESIVDEIVFIEIGKMRELSFLGHVVDNLIECVLVVLLDTFDGIHGGVVYLILGTFVDLI